MKISIKTVDGTRYDLPSGNRPVLQEKCGLKWFVINVTGKAYWISLNNVVCITETED